MSQLELVRKCPKCDSEIRYRHKSSFYHARKRNSRCKACHVKVLNNRDRSGTKNPFYGRTHTKEAIKKIQRGDRSYTQSDDYRRIKSVQCSGSGNPMYGRTYYDRWIEKYGKEEADRRLAEKSRKTSKQVSGSGNPMYGRPPPKGSGTGWSGWYKGWFFRSLLELSYRIKKIETKGLKWCTGESDEFRIEYDIDGETKCYFPDFILEEEALVVECKPKKLHNSRLVIAKTDAAMRFCKSIGFRYLIVDCGILELDKIIELRESSQIRFTKRSEQKFVAFLERKRNGK